MGPAERDFHVADLYTVWSGRLVTPRGVEALYDVIDFVTGESHMTHQLPRASEIVGPEVLRQHPWLAEIQSPDVNSWAEAATWAAAVAAEQGEMHTVVALPEGAYVGREPIAEFREMAPHVPIIPVGGEAPTDLDGGPR